MYETYFNLTERPFASVPRSDHYYAAAVISAARSTLARCIERGEGVAMVIGPAGTGKSLLCQVLAKQFKKKFEVALLASAHLDTRRSLLQAILYELGRPFRGMDEGELRLSLVDYATLNNDSRDGLVLLVDEAHHLPLRLLDEICSLTNLTRDMQPAVRMVLAGSHLLEERFASPKLESFSQRISARCYLEAFQRNETEAYIQSRFSKCGGRAADVFPAETCQTVHKATDGVPRLINQVCDHVLLLAYAAGIRRIEPAHVAEAWADLQQLPTPWNAPAAPAGDSVIEFGGLDDGPFDSTPIAGRIVADEFETAAELALTQPSLVAEATEEDLDTDESSQTDEQLLHIQHLLADVQAEFQPATSFGPEVELVFDSPHPFAETFDEEEVITDRYAVLAAAPAVCPPFAVPAESAAVVVPVETADAQPATTRESRAKPQPETIPMHNVQADKRELRRAEALPESELAATAAAADEEPSSRPIRSVVPPPRQEFRRLFARLRQGL